MQQQQRQQQLADPSQPGILHQQNSQQQQLPDTFHEQCAWLMDKLLLEHQDVCFGQHMSVVVACVAYVAAKLLQVNITFRRVTEVQLFSVPSSGLSYTPLLHVVGQCSTWCPSLELSPVATSLSPASDVYETAQPVQQMLAIVVYCSSCLSAKGNNAQQHTRPQIQHQHGVS